MNYSRNLLFAVLLLILLSLCTASGCTSGAENCGDALSQINSLENSANGRVKTMDLSNTDEFVYAQAEASKNQYYDALVLLTSGSVKDCMTDVKYKNLVKSLELKYAFLDMYIRFGETEKTASAMIYESYPQFQKSLKETMSDLENLRYESKSLLVVADDIDSTQLDPENQDMIPVIEKDIGVVLSKIDLYISVLVSYQ